MSATGKTMARWPPGTEVIGKTSDYYAAGRLPDKLDFFEGEELTVVGSTGNRRSYEARRKRDGAIGVLTADDVVPELTKRPDQLRLPILARVMTTVAYEAHKPGYLSFKRDEVLEVLDTKIPFWLLVRRRLVTGYIHTLYVKGITEEDRRILCAGDTGYYPRVRATISHSTVGFNELAFREGDVLEVTTTKQLRENFWRGQSVSGGMTIEGYVPIASVRPLMLNEWDAYTVSTAVAAIQSPTSPTNTFRSKVESQKLLQDALARGFVLFNVINVVLTGVAGAGKTHSKYLLLGEPPPELRQSTPLAEAPIRAISHTINGSVETVTNWMRTSGKQLLNLLAELIVAGVYMENGKQSAPPVHSNGKSALKRFSAGLREAVAHNHHWRFGRRLSAEELEDESPSFGELVRFLEHSSGSKRFLEVQWIHFIDSGGQPEFNNVLPQFMNNTMVHVHIHKMSERLNERPIIECYDEGGRPCGKPYRSTQQNDKIMRGCLQSMHAQGMASNGSGRRVRTILLGTHRDLEHTSTESGKQKNRELLGTLPQTLLDDIVFRDQTSKDMIFSVNAKAPEPCDYDTAAHIRRIITDKKQAPPPYKVPIGWFLLEQDIAKLAEKLGRDVVSKEDCQQIARRLNINDTSLEAALEYFDQLNIFLYKPTLLPHLVFSNPQAPLDVFSELVVHSYLFRSTSMINPLAGDGILQRFQEKGIVTAEILGSPMFAKFYVTGLYGAEDIITLYKGLLMAAPVTKTDFLMPSLLPEIAREDIAKHRSDPSRSPVAPLLLHSVSGCSPNGLFSALVCYLLQHCRWQLSYAPGSLLTPACLYRTCIEFQPPTVSSKVVLIDSGAYIEVHPKSNDRFPPQVSTWISKALLNGLDEVSKTLHYEVGSHKLAFFCESPQCASHAPHTATIDPSFRFWRCTRSAGMITGWLSNEHLVWLNKEGSSSPVTLYK